MGPLSIVAAAWCVWGLRAADVSGEALPVLLSASLVAAAFASSFGLWIVGYYWLVKPLDFQNVEDSHKKTVDEVAADRLYTWFNCNPVFVLKCAHYFLDASGKSIDDRRRGHPMASGAEEDEVRAYEI